MLYAIVAIAVWTLALNHAASGLHMLDHGLSWLTTSRDQADRPDPSVREERMARAHRNHLENVVVFLPMAILAMHLGHGATTVGVVAGWTFLAARLGHVLFYVRGIAPLRSVSHMLGLSAHAAMLGLILGLW